MAKIILNDVNLELSPAAATEALNANWAAIEAFCETVLSRDGTLPNQMEVNLDMNGKSIINHVTELGDGVIRRVEQEGAPGNTQVLIKDLVFVGATVSSDGSRRAKVTFSATGSLVSYDNTTSGLAADTVQEAIDEVVVNLGAVATAGIVTVGDEQTALPNSRRLVAGANVTIDTDTPDQLILNALGVRNPGATWVRNGSAIALPTNNVSVYVPVNCTITGVVVLTEGGPGNCVIDVRKTSFSNYPGSYASICASAKPTLVNVNKVQDSTLTGWTTAVSAGDTLRFVLESTDSFTYIHIVLIVEEVT